MVKKKVKKVKKVKKIEETVGNIGIKEADSKNLGSNVACVTE